MPLKDVAPRILRDHRVRFLLVGGINTVFGFLMFAALDLTVGRALDDRGLHVIASIVTLLLAHAIASVLAFVLYRRFVFRVSGHATADFIRFQGVYAVPLAINLVVLPMIVAVGVPRILAQGCIIVVTTLFSYFGHRFFSFRRREESGAEQDAISDVFLQAQRAAAAGAEDAQ